jgi:hypothetical protein
MVSCVTLIHVFFGTFKIRYSVLFSFGCITAAFQRLDHIAASDVMVIDRMGYMGWLNLAQDRDKWRALLNKMMYLCVLHNVGKFLSK